MTPVPDGPRSFDGGKRVGAIRLRPTEYRRRPRGVAFWIQPPALAAPGAPRWLRLGRAGSDRWWCHDRPSRRNVPDIPARRNPGDTRARRSPAAKAIRCQRWWRPPRRR